MNAQSILIKTKSEHSRAFANNKHEKIQISIRRGMNDDFSLKVCTNANRQGQSYDDIEISYHENHR